MCIRDSPQTVIGVRMPALRKLAREIAGTPVAEGFLQEPPHRYYEENNLCLLYTSRCV